MSTSRTIVLAAVLAGAVAGCASHTAPAPRGPAARPRPADIAAVGAWCGTVAWGGPAAWTASGPAVPVRIVVDHRGTHVRRIDAVGDPGILEIAGGAAVLGPPSTRKP
jgi:hypothetical protein